VGNDHASGLGVLHGCTHAKPFPVRALPAPVSGREIDFVKLSPTQNMTVLVRTAHPVEDYRDIALQLMSYGHVHAEQVGFVRRPVSLEADAGLYMAAGEFCGNACMALAALHAAERITDADRAVDVVLEASGTEDFVRCRVEKRGGEYSCRLAMPVPRVVESGALISGVVGGSAIVRYDNALHVVIEAAQLDLATREKAQSLAARLGETWPMSLIGVMVYTPSLNRLAPLIHVPSLGSMVWERGCGSGTASLGAYLAWKHKTSVETSVVQPGGTMFVAANHERGGLRDIRVEGSVRIVAEGKAYIAEVADVDSAHDWGLEGNERYGSAAGAGWIPEQAQHIGRAL